MKTPDAALIMREAFRSLFGREPNRRELEFALAQSHGESSWGEGWKGDCRGSNNWGALQIYPGYTGGVCNAVDSNADGKYDAGFQTWSNPLEGAKGYLKEAYKRRPGVLAAVNAGDINGAVSELYRTGYFTGNACLQKSSDGKCAVIDHATNKARYRALIVDRLTGARPGLPSISRELTAAGYKGGPASRGAVSSAGPIGVVVFLAVAGAALVALRR